MEKIELPLDYKEMLTSISEDLNGDIQFYTCSDHTGDHWNKIVIEYNHNSK